MSIRYMTMVWDEFTELDGGNLLVMLTIADHANDQGICWPSISTISKKARLSVRQTKRIIKDLSTRGYIKVEEKAGRSKTNIYQIQTKGDMVSPIGEIKGDMVSPIGEIKGDTMSPFSVPLKGDICDIKGDICDIKGDICDIKGDMAPHAHVEPPIEPPIEPSTEPPIVEPSGSDALFDVDENAVDVKPEQLTIRNSIVEIIPEEKPLTDWQRLTANITWCVHGHTDFSIIPEDGPKGKGAITREAKIIKNAGYGYEDVRTWWKEIWCPAKNWTTKNGSMTRPLPSEIRSGIPAINAPTQPDAQDMFMGEKVAKLSPTVKNIYNMMRKEGMI